VRIAVLILGILGAFGSGCGGLLLQIGKNASKEKLEFVQVFGQAVAEDKDADPEKVAEVKAALKAIHFLSISIPLLYAGTGIGLVGAFFGFFGRGKSAAALLLVAAFGPALFVPFSLIFTGILIVAGLLALFIRPKRLKQFAPEFED
jgi:hypothetical protein